MATECDQKISELHKVALEYAARGIPVFPCIPGSKQPAIEGGFHAATTDAEQINAWWGQRPDYNVAFEPEKAGWAVLDVEAEGLADWEQYQIENGDVETYSVDTPRGGKHFYFHGSLPSRVKLRNAAGQKQQMDTRGVGGYVLVPPSTVGGKAYAAADDAFDIADLPPWLSTRVTTSFRTDFVADVPLDDPGNLERAVSLLKRHVSAGDVAIAGVGGNARTFEVAQEMRDHGATEPVALQLIRDNWNEHCLPPWPLEDLAVIVANAYKYGQNAPGAHAVASAVANFASPALDKLLKESAAQPTSRSRFWPRDDDEMDQTPPASWAVKDVLPQTGTVLVFGPTQNYKSFLLLDAALGLATGKPVWGIEPSVKGCVFYGANEGRDDIMRSRRPAWRIAHDVKGKTNFYVMLAPMIALDDEKREFIDQIDKRRKGKPVAAIFLETATKMMIGLDATRDVPRLVQFCDFLVEYFKCVVVVSHHSGHDVDKGPKDSSSYRQNFDTVIQVTSPAKLITQAKILKHKDAAEPDVPFAFEGKPVANSLVFQRTTYTELKEKTKAENAFDGRKIGAALKKLGAVGLENAVTTHVLAAEMTPQLENETVEDREAALSFTSRRLGSLSRTSLEAYRTKTKAGIQWHLP